VGVIGVDAFETNDAGERHGDDDGLGDLGRNFAMGLSLGAS
jgi:hypothetical protein